MATAPANSMHNLIAPPPRMTGNAQQDAISALQWEWDLFQHIITGTLLQTPNLPSSLSANLQAFSALVGAADKLAYFTGPAALSLTTLTAFARTLLADADDAAAKATLGIPAVIGDVTGPAGATDGDLAVFDGASGKTLKDGGTISTALAAYQLRSEKDAASGYAGLSAASRVTKGVFTTDYIASDDTAKGHVYKSPNGHYWKMTVDNAGVPTTTDLGLGPI